jgi:signal transduction histidine kinase
MIGRLRWKFIIAVMVITALILASALAAFYYFMERDIARESTDALMRAAGDPILSTRPWEPGHARRPHFIVDTDANGGIVDTYGSTFDQSDEDILEQIVFATLARGRMTGVLDGYNLRYYKMKLRNGWRAAYNDISFEKTMLSDFSTNALLIGAAIMAAVFLNSILLARWMVGPAERVWKQQKQFVADASHELKTPLSVVQSNAEMLSAHYGGSGDESSRWAENIKTGSLQMRRLIEEMLHLARTDADTAAAVKDPVDFSSLVSGASLRFEPAAYEKGLVFTERIAPGLYVTGDAEMLRRLAEILLDNAVKYCVPGGEVRAGLESRPHKTVLLRVSNPSGAPVDASRIFDRFYRGDTARGTDGGFGLGLSIGRNIVRAHHGKIWVEHTGGIVTFSVSLPGAPGPDADRA